MVESRISNIRNNDMIIKGFELDNKKNSNLGIDEVSVFEEDENIGRIGDAEAPDISIIETLSFLLVGGFTFASGLAANDFLKTSTESITIYKKYEPISKLIRFLLTVFIAIIFIYAVYYVVGVNTTTAFIRR